MKLKRVNIFGFKTFADRTNLDLDGDIIAVVGPNGCGKSNIVDAIMWGLGEANARSLRAQTSKEVIFAGSTKRKPLGFGEVTLTFENEDGKLPVDTSEVSIGRRLTRSGDSQFQINKRNCRLRDVSDLLADSGMGKAGYAIVTQSEIDQALAASATQRRAWIDEASGVQRYRARRNEAMRSMENASTNLERVNDIIREIETQRGPLAAEAEAAKRYKSVLGSLREVESSLLIKELADATESCLELDLKIRESIELSEKEAKRAADLDGKSRAMAGEIRQLEEEIELLRKKQIETQIQFEQAKSNLQVSEHRLQSLDELENSIEEESTLDQLRTLEAEKEAAITATDLAKEERFLATLKERLVGADEETEALARKLEEAEKQLARAKGEWEARRKSEIQRAHQLQRREEIQKSVADIDSALKDLEDESRSAESEALKLLQKLESVKAERKKLQAAKEEQQAKAESLAKTRRELLSHLATLEGKKAGLEATIEAHEGISAGSRAILEAVESGELAGDFFVVGEVIDTDPAHSLAIETALGSLANDLIVESDKDAIRAIEFLRDEKLGRATFHPLNLAPIRQYVLSLPEGAIGIAADMVVCEDRFRPVIDALLGSVLVVSDLNVAVAVAQETLFEKVVTLEGELATRSGSIEGGAALRQSSGLIQRRADLNEVLVQIESDGEEASKLELEATEIELAAASIGQKIDEALIEIEAHDKEYLQARNWAMNLGHELKSTKNEKEKLLQELAGLEEPELQFEGSAEDLPLAEKHRDEVLQEFTAKSADARSAKTRLQEAQERLQAASHRHETAQRRVKNLEEARFLRAQKASNLQPERESMRSKIAESRTAMSERQSELEGLHAKSQALSESRQSYLDQVGAMSEESRSAERSSQSLIELNHKNELKRAREDSKRATAAQRLIEEYGIEESAALAKKGEVELPKDAQSLVHGLRKELKAMGEVNLGAIEAYDRLTERHEELTHQVEDILAGMEQIKGSISELDRKTEERFSATFTALQVAFGEMFQKMFGGGEGVLELTESENVLDSGVEIGVTIPGKRRQRLELLSGGERAMSALAFLFALLKVNPTPLVILDEVDAPLDGRNVERFIEMLRSFNDRTQFILITHNNVTIESADVWFGVTMQEPGVSSVIPYKVSPKAPVEPEEIYERSTSNPQVSLKG